MVGGDGEHHRVRVPLGNRHRGKPKRAGRAACHRLNDDVVRRQLRKDSADAFDLMLLGDDVDLIDQRQDALKGLPEERRRPILQREQMLGLAATGARPQPRAGSAGEYGRVNRHGRTSSSLRRRQSMRVLGTRVGVRPVKRRTIGLNREGRVGAQRLIAGRASSNRRRT